MKDIEKIKSEDLACQVADANPANFAIEQEVAQLVGATVPAPTEPSADDARELGAQLLVFLRRALLPIQTALRTAVAAIYAHLDSRCTDYTPAAYAPYQDPSTVPPYDPMRPLTPRTLPNLLTALTAFSDRKISEPNAVDGISIANLLCSAAASDLVAISDNNAGWVGKRSLDTITSRFPSVKSISAKVTEFDQGVSILTSGIVEELYLPSLTKIVYNTFALLNIENIELPSLVSIEQRVFTGREGGGNVFCGSSKIKTISLPALEFMATGNYLHSFCANNTVLEEISMPNCTRVICWSDGKSFYNNPLLAKVELGTLTEFSTSSTQQAFGNCPALIDLEIGEGTAISLNLAYWSPTLDSSNLDQFLQNFREHIALRLTANGSGLTLTLSQEVRNAIHAAESTYGIEAIIVTQKGWRIQPDAS